MCFEIHKWAQYASGMEQANSWLNDSVVFVFNYYHFLPSGPKRSKPEPLLNSKVYIQQMNTHTRVSEGKIGNVEVLVSLPDTSKPKEWQLIIDLRGKVGNTYESVIGTTGYMTDANLQKYGWNEATGEGIILRGKLNHREARFYDWEIGFTAAGDSTSFNIVRSVPMEFKAMIGE